MLGEDVQPSRLARARHKLRDLLERRRGARTALVAYAGSAHVALPLTDDAELLESYLDALDPALMPRPGNDPGRALALAETLLAPEPVAGSVLFLTDGIDRAEAEAFRAFAARTGAQPLLLGFGRDLDRAGLEAVADAAGGRARVAALDDGDVDALERGIRTHLVDALGADDALDWRDRGHALVWGVAFCMAFWFRRGWTVQWRV